jgi:hypothetical protein
MKKHVHGFWRIDQPERPRRKQVFIINRSAGRRVQRQPVDPKWSEAEGVCR